MGDPVQVVRRVYNCIEGQTDRPTCGPLAVNCCQCIQLGSGGLHGWTVYRCCRCGDEDWL